MSYIIKIKSKGGSDLFSIKDGNRNIFGIFDDEKFNDEDTFQHSVIVFNENIEDVECMVIVENLCEIQKPHIYIYILVISKMNLQELL